MSPCFSSWIAGVPPALVARDAAGTAAVRSASAGHIDGDAGDEIGVLRRQKADNPRLVDRLGDAAQRRVVDRPRLILLAAPFPMRADALGQGGARRDRVDVDAVRPELVRELLVKAMI